MLTTSTEINIKLKQVNDLSFFFVRFVHCEFKANTMRKYNI